MIPLWGKSFTNGLDLKLLHICPGLAAPATVVQKQTV